MKPTIFMLLTLFLGIFAEAQVTGPSSGAQIAQVRDYVDSLLNRSSNSPNQGISSVDYERSSSLVKRMFEDRLLQFKAVMDSFMSGSLMISIEQYNQTVRDSSLASSERDVRLKAQMNILQSLIKLATSSFQAVLRALYDIEPSWVNEDDGLNGKIQKRLNQLCRSRVCQRAILADYVYFYANIRNQLDRPLNVDLADGRKLTIRGMEGSPRLIDSLVTFEFYHKDYLRLPESVSR